MRLRLDGSETKFEEAYPRAPFAPLIHLVVLAAETATKTRRGPRPPVQVDPADLRGPPTPLSSAG